MGLFGLFKRSNKDVVSEIKDINKVFNPLENVKNRIAESVSIYGDRIKSVYISYYFGKSIPVSIEVNGVKYTEFQAYYNYNPYDGKIRYNEYLTTAEIGSDRYFFNVDVSLLLDNGEVVKAVYVYGIKDSFQEAVRVLLEHLFYIYVAIVDLGLHNRYVVYDDTGLAHALLSAINVGVEDARRFAEEMKKEAGSENK